jgi:hypothetical protein
VSIRERTSATWDAVSAADPEVLVIGACGFDAEEAQRGRADPGLPLIELTGTGTFATA